MEKLFTEKFKNNVESNMDRIIELQLDYLALKFLDDCVKDQFKMASEKVLAENEFYVSEENLDTFYSRRGMETGTRILEDRDTFLMSADDFEVYLKLYTAENCKRGLTDEKGFYTEETNTSNALAHLKDKIVHYAVELLPDIPEKETLMDAVTPGRHYHYKTWEKIFDLFMDIR